MERYEIFKKALVVPGDIVECVIFKETGVAYWLKLIEVFVYYCLLYLSLKPETAR